MFHRTTRRRSRRAPRGARGSAPQTLGRQGQRGEDRFGSPEEPPPLPRPIATEAFMARPLASCCLRAAFCCTLLVLGSCTAPGDGPRETSWHVSLAEATAMSSAISLEPWASRLTGLRGLVVSYPDQSSHPVYGVIAGDVLLSINGTACVDPTACRWHLRQLCESRVTQFVTRWLSQGQPVQRTFVLSAE